MRVKATMYVMILVLTAVAVLYAYFRFFEVRSVYFPSKEIAAIPPAVGLDYEDVYFEAADGTTLNGWFIPCRGKSRGTLLFCHGNAGNISHRLGLLKAFNAIGLNVFIFDYRGYGRSSGVPSEKGTYSDAAGAYEYLEDRRDVDNDGIIVYGKSLGGVVAIDLSAAGRGAVLISDSAFTSAKDMAKAVYPLFPVSGLLTIKYDSLSRIKEVDQPKLIIHSKDDEIVPFSHGRRLFEAAAEPKRFHAFRGGHNEGVIDNEDEYIRAIDRFLGENGI